MIVITGASGHIGRRAAEILLRKGLPVRVVGRNAERLQPLTRRGAEAAVGYLRDTTFLTRVFKDAQAVFTMIPSDYAAEDFRGFQIDVGASIAAAIRATGVGEVVNLSSQGADLVSGTGPILGLRDQEKRLDALPGVNVVHLRPTYFMENLFMNIPLILHRGMAGSAVRGDVPIAMIATCDIADRVAEWLQKADFEGSRVEDLLGERDLTLAEATAILGRRIGRPELKYVQFSAEEARQGMRGMGVGADAARLLIEMSQALNEGRFAVGVKRTPRNTTATSIEQFAETFAAAYHDAQHHEAA